MVARRRSDKIDAPPERRTPCSDGTQLIAIWPQRTLSLLRERPVGAWLALLGLTAALALYGATAGDAAWEVEVIRWVQGASPDALEAVAEFMTTIGNWPASAFIPAIAVVALWIAGHRWLSFFLVLAIVGRVTSGLVKELVDRPRPSDSLVNVAHQLGDPSFPSGHVVTATLLYGFLIYSAEFCIAGRGVRRLVQGLLVVVIALMGYARIELGAHWPTDVLGGYALGLLVLLAIVWLHRRFDARARAE
jgi:membrane-associated phospholipid phosphatase